VLIPKLKACAVSWISNRAAVLQEIADWYLAWKEILPPVSEGMQSGLAELLLSIESALDSRV
jgi:hypothetical protein